MSFDLADLNAALTSQEEGEELVLRNPYTGDDTDIVVRIACAESTRVKTAARAAINRLYAKRAKNKHERIEDSEELLLTTVAASIISWRGVVFEGKPFECTPSNARKLIEMHLGFLEQIKSFSEERANFLPK